MVVGPQIVIDEYNYNISFCPNEWDVGDPRYN